jgi:hypothetical protein
MSVAFLVILMAVIAARRLDPNNAEGNPTTQAQFRTHSIAALAIGMAIWIVANLLGNHWLE